MSTIQRYSRIPRTSLSEEFFVQSLLQEAARLGEMSSATIEDVLTQFAGLLAVSTEKYNGGRSSSVKIEVAQSIMASGFYTVGLYLKSLPDTSSMLESLSSERIFTIYERGRTMIDSNLRIARELLELVRRTRIPTPNHAYNATIDEGIEMFFQQYDADYAAHEIPASIDYQLLNSVTGLAGVEYMIRYLENLHMENMLCATFDPVVIHEVMRGYDEGYEDLLVNLCEQVLQNALGCMLRNNSDWSEGCRRLDISRLDVERLTGMLTGKGKDSTLSLFRHMAEVLVERLGLGSKALLQYLLGGLPEMAFRVCHSIELGTLHTVFVPRKSDRQDVIKYASTNKMDDEVYRDVVKEIVSCRHSYDKVQIIKELIRSLSDMEDVITDGDLTLAEASEVLDLLNDTEIAILAKRHPYDSEMEKDGYSERETRLAGYLDKYVQELPELRQAQIRELIRKVWDD